jgi:hypothetical protein
VVGTEAIGKGNTEAVAEASWAEGREGFAAWKVGVENERRRNGVGRGGADDCGDGLRVESRSGAVDGRGVWCEAKEAVVEGVEGRVDAVTESRWVRIRWGR